MAAFNNEGEETEPSMNNIGIIGRGCYNQHKSILDQVTSLQLGFLGGRRDKAIQPGVCIQANLSLKNKHKNQYNMYSSIQRKKTENQMDYPLGTSVQVPLGGH